MNLRQGELLLLIVCIVVLVNLLVGSLLYLLRAVRVLPVQSGDWLVVVLTEHDETLAKGNIVLCVQIDECPFTELTCLSVVDCFLEGHDHTSCSVWIDSDDVQAGLLVDRSVVARGLTILLCALLQVDTFYKLLEVGFNLGSRFVTNFVEALEMTDGWLSWDLGF